MNTGNILLAVEASLLGFGGVFVTLVLFFVVTKLLVRWNPGSRRDAAEPGA